MHLKLSPIRAHQPCRDGWVKLLASLGGASTPLDTVVSLGDVARSNGAADAWWCVRCLDWSDIAVRRAVIGALLPAIRRAAEHTQDQRVHDCVATVARWQAGDDEIDLCAEVAAAEAKSWAAAADVAAAALLLAQPLNAWAVAWAAAAAAAAADAADAEREIQRNDLIAAFPPLHGRPE